MNTLGIRACTGTGGTGDTYLTGCLEVDVLLDNQDINVGIDEKLVDIGASAYNTSIEVPVYTVDVTPGESDVDVTIQVVDLNGCN